MSASTSPIATAMVPRPSAAGASLSLASSAARLMADRAACAFRLVVAQAAARLLAQVAPDLRHIAPERLAGDDLGGARARQFDLDRTFQPARPIGHDQDPIGQLHGLGDVVGDEQRRLFELLLDLQHLVAEEEPRLLVERRERLVHQHDGRACRQRPRHRHPLAHPAGQRRRVAALEAGKADQLDEMPGPVMALGFGDAGDLQRERNIVEHGAPRKRRFLLKDHADCRMRPRYALARDTHRALARLGQAADDVEQGRFAAARRPDHRHELAGRDREGDVIDGGEDSVGGFEPLDDVIDDENGLARLRESRDSAFRRHGHRGHWPASSRTSSVARDIAQRLIPDMRLNSGRCVARRR